MATLRYQHPWRQLIDGSMNTFGHSFKYTTEYPWVRIDYGEGRAFGKVVVTNRRDCCSARAIGMSVVLSADQCTHDRTNQKAPDCSDAALWTAKLKEGSRVFTFDSLPNAGDPSTSSTSTTTTATSTTVTNHLAPKVADLQGKLDAVQEVMEEQIKQNEAQVLTLKSTIKYVRAVCSVNSMVLSE